MQSFIGMTRAAISVTRASLSFRMIAWCARSSGHRTVQPRTDQQDHCRICQAFRYFHLLSVMSFDFCR
jgi:hypothetical protein